MIELHACHIRVTRLCVVLGFASLALLAGCESEVFGTLSPASVETQQETLQPAGAAGASGGTNDPGHVNEGPPNVGGIVPAPDAALRSCEGITVECRSPVVSADLLPGRTLPQVQT